MIVVRNIIFFFILLFLLNGCSEDKTIQQTIIATKVANIERQGGKQRMWDLFNDTERPLHWGFKIPSELSELPKEKLIRLSKYIKLNYGDKEVKIPIIYELSRRNDAVYTDILESLLISGYDVYEHIIDAFIENNNKLSNKTLYFLYNRAKSSKYDSARIKCAKLCINHSYEKKQIETILIEIYRNTKQPEIQEQVICALGNTGGEDAVDILIEVFSNDKNAVMIRRAAVKSVQLIGGNKAGKALVDMLDRKDQAILWWCINAVGNMKYKPAIPCLVNLFKYKYLHEVLVSNLGYILHQDFGEDVQKWQQWWDANKDRILKEIEEENKKEEQEEQDKPSNSAPEKPAPAAPEKSAPKQEEEKK